MNFDIFVWLMFGRLLIFRFQLRNESVIIVTFLNGLSDTCLRLQRSFVIICYDIIYCYLSYIFRYNNWQPEQKWNEKWPMRPIARRWQHKVWDKMLKLWHQILNFSKYLQPQTLNIFHWGQMESQCSVSLWRCKQFWILLLGDLQSS